MSIVDGAGIGEQPLGGRLTDHVSLGVLSATFPRDLIEEVVNVTGRREQRSRLLPAHVMVRYVVALGLLFGEAYEEVMRQLTDSLQALGSWDRAWQVPTTSAISQARQRLGSEPLRELFARAAVPVAGLGTKGGWLAGRRLMALDGTSFDVPDTAANVKAFGRMGSGPKASAFPKLSVVAISECGTHANVAAALGSCRTGERTLAGGLLGALEPGMLLLADSGFYSFKLFNAAAETGADLAWRIGASVQVSLVRWLADGSYLGLVFAPGLRASRREGLVAAARAGHDIDGELARLVRVVEYTVTNREGGGTAELICVLTTILDPAEVPAKQLAWAYHQRWEHETGLDEIKTHLRGGGEVLRSKSPQMVEQEMWGLLLAHYAIRALMCKAADEAGLDPDRLAFIRAVRVARRRIDDPAAVSP